MSENRRSVASLIAALAVAAACGHPAGAPSSSTVNRPKEPSVVGVAGVEVFDTDPLTVARVMARHGDSLRALLESGASVDAERLVTEIRADGEYAYVQPSLVTYFENHARYLTIDIVDRREAEWRMPFRPAPLGSYPDPGGLIAAWQAYEAKQLELLHRGQLRRPPADCPSFHCLGDPNQPELRPLASALSGAVDHVNELSLILRDDGRVDHRAAAAFLLPYAKDGNVVVASLLPALHDGSMIVRNNALRVLAEIALHHPEVDIPIEPVIEALSFPSTADRNKAAATLYRLLERPDGARLRRRVTLEAGTVLLAMLRLVQPNNHDYAYKVLKSLSGQSYGDRDYAAWQAWLDRASATVQKGG